MSHKEDLLNMISLIEANDNYKMFVAVNIGSELSELREKLAKEYNKIINDEQQVETNKPTNIIKKA